MPTELTSAQLKMDPSSLYREEVFTGPRIGTIRVLTPVKTDGLTDASRRALYVGEAELAVERTVRELQELRREAASSIIVPDRPIPGLGGRGGTRGGGLITPP